MKFKPANPQLRKDFIEKLLSQPGTKVYECKCGILNAIKHKAVACGICQSTDIKLVKKATA